MTYEQMMNDPYGYSYRNRSRSACEGPCLCNGFLPPIKPPSQKVFYLAAAIGTLPAISKLAGGTVLPWPDVAASAAGAAGTTFVSIAALMVVTYVLSVLGAAFTIAFRAISTIGVRRH